MPGQPENQFTLTRAPRSTTRARKRFLINLLPVALIAVAAVAGLTGSAVTGAPSPAGAAVQAPSPPNWEPFLTREGALESKHGHVQGMCVASNAVYMTLHNGVYKFDWKGNLLKKIPADIHQGDICRHGGKLYVAVDVSGQVPLKGRIDVYDEDLNFVKRTSFKRAADGIVCLDGILYVGLGPARIPGKPFRGNYFGKFDAETLESLCEPFLVDHGYDCSAGVQNLATDGVRIYANFYTPEPDTPCFIVFDRNFNVLDAHVFGWRHGLDVVSGGEGGAVCFAYLTTIGWMGQKEKGTPPPQALVRYAELQDAKMRDISQFISFPRSKKNAATRAPETGKAVATIKVHHEIPGNAQTTRSLLSSMRVRTPDARE